MANQISGDKFSAHQPVRQREPDASPGDRRLPHTPESRNSPPADRADVGRAHQLLSQEAEGARGPAIDGENQARLHAARLKDQLTAAPQAAVKAHGGIDANVFEAAMARPTA